MGTTAELVMPTSEFALAHTLSEASSLTAGIEPLVATDPARVMPYVTFRGQRADVDGLESTLAADPSVREATALTNGDETSRFRIEWDPTVTETVRTLTETDASILEATAENTHWRFRLLVPRRDDLSRTYDAATEAGLTLDVVRVHEMESDERSRYGLTDAQHETLIQALEHGYYEIPRTVDMEELATHLEISHQALSERLRRAHRRLVTEALDADDDGE
ncbi:helix-turn-helix domain-containing protein [Halovivax limisalsi]|uniref:helix-turn-helix domain-containing protein n=1 Tax=Halovivax limisalsi TaxID=1453760 RepID=UPI001FFD691D|nr:helix-turn-helix domain-containing protein [Halovivax limisalsi]